MIPIPAQKDRYWARVARALAILKARPMLADSLRHDIDQLPPEEQALFYHVEPFDVARDIAGVESWPEEALREYARSARTADEDKLGTRATETEPIIASRLPHKSRVTWRAGFAAAAGVAIVVLLVQAFVVARIVTQQEGSLEAALRDLRTLRMDNETLLKAVSQADRRIDTLRAELTAIASTGPTAQAQVSRPSVLRFTLPGDRAGLALQLTAPLDTAIPLWLTLPRVPNDVAFDVEIRSDDRKVVWRAPAALKPTVVPGERGDVALIEVVLPPGSLRAGEPYDVRWSTGDTDPPLTLHAPMETRR